MKNPLKKRKDRMDFNINKYIEQNKKLVDDTLERIIPPETEYPFSLHRAMRYSLFAGGKRIRPILAIAACEAVGGDPLKVVREACALEFIHTYTLIHDDLPCMDDDDYRRGRLTPHKVFGEATAVLAGDALQTAAFKVLAEGSAISGHSPEKVISAIDLLAFSAGSQGVIGGQVVDLESEGKTIDEKTLEYIHMHKTGKLICASVLLGALFGNALESEIINLRKYGEAIGLAFQITDDILDVVGNTEDLGKTTGSDEKKGKATYPSIVGLEVAKGLQVKYYRESIEALKCFEEKASALREIARIVVKRTN